VPDSSYRFGRFELRCPSRLLLRDSEPVELGARAFDVLLALVEHRDRLISKDELLRLVWPGLVVEENNLQVQVSVLRKILGAEAISTIPGRGYRFALDTHADRHEEAAPPEARAAAALPQPPTSFIGRETALEDCAQRLAHTRLLTLVAVGGCGKTRLAIELARRVSGTFRDGASFVDLAPVTAPERVVPAIAAALTVREEPDRPILDSLCRSLERKHALIVLDNCEHVLDACATLTEELLARTSSVTVLATSRERLGIAGEQVEQVHPLGVGAAAIEDSSVQMSEAVRLFADRARVVAPDFTLAADMLPAVDEICRRLEGLPLAIELAAARLRVLTVHDINARLDDRFRLLTTHDRSHRRHQTLRGAIDWSYDQLEPQEQEAFRRLSVFAGGWTLEAASAVAGRSADDIDAIDWLSRLVDKSLIVVQPGSGPQRRYRMLETVRAYAVERIDAAGETEDARELHLRYFVALAERSAYSPNTGRDPAATDRLDPELDNFVAAHDWCSAHPASAGLGLRLVGALNDFLVDRGHLRLGRAMVERALSRPGAPDEGRTRAAALTAAGRLCDELGDQSAALNHFAQAIALARAGGHIDVGVAVLMRAGGAAQGAGNLPQARRYLEDGLALARLHGMSYCATGALIALGEVCRQEKRLDQAAAHYEEALAIQRSNGLLPTMALFNVAIVANERGDYVHAGRCLREMAKEAGTLHSAYLEWCVLQHAAALASATGDAKFAARAWGAFDAAAEATGLALQRADLDFLTKRIEEARKALGGALFAEAFAAGRTLSSRDALAEFDAWLEHYLAAAETGAGEAARVKS
jgi:non-specific serine/threonine protein kinase